MLYCEMGNTITEEYTVKIEYDKKTGHRVREFWFQEGELHRVGAPAAICFNSQNGAVSIEEYRERGILHRLEGPAWILRDENTGSALISDYYIMGKKIKSPKEPTMG